MRSLLVVVLGLAVVGCEDSEKAETDGGGGDVPGKWVTVAKGAFSMGSPAAEPCRSSNETAHQVTLTHSFEIQSTEITQGQFEGLMGYNPSGFVSCGATCPVETVSWHEAAAYCNALSAQKGYAQCYSCTGSEASADCAEASDYAAEKVYACPGYRLPTEAEWEYAYRAGTATAYFNGANDGTLCTDCTKRDAVADRSAWYCANASSRTHPVGEKQVNILGLYDMGGNVAEWCHDWYQASLGADAVTDPWGADSDTGTQRVARGGSWNLYARDVRAARRDSSPPSIQGNIIGARCARSRPDLD
jgi:formylglycine-generating enzyme required for sulfatase activity